VDYKAIKMTITTDRMTMKCCCCWQWR